MGLRSAAHTLPYVGTFLGAVVMQVISILACPRGSPLRIDCPGRRQAWFPNPKRTVADVVVQCIKAGQHGSRGVNEACQITVTEHTANSGSYSATKASASEMIR